jgi:hypothetical protein
MIVLIFPARGENSSSRTRGANRLTISLVASTDPSDAMTMSSRSSE